jgi:hypothetical protein
MKNWTGCELDISFEGAAGGESALFYNQSGFRSRREIFYLDSP